MAPEDEKGFQDPFAMEYIRHLEKTMVGLASAESVANLTERLERLETRVMERIDQVFDQERQNRADREAKERSSLTRMLGIQGSILVGSLVAILGTLIAHILSGA